ncbi:LOW QUALITY PROTEIN: hypothetical protein KUTeg_001691 [Tegillarca granosa]|uniref:Egg-lysin n=1 Tax=Tegillarca granosa TaxID=220873 RepID=A0ABQ9FS65_TEGGR|nr:LOW QUALITY PROTEIN: hypothetical protein KUTeg_001691 [Tegillarca granosa]
MHCSVRSLISGLIFSLFYFLMFAGVLNGMTTSAASVAALLSPVITSEITKNILVFRRFYTAREKKMAAQFSIHQYGVNAVSGFGDLVKHNFYVKNIHINKYYSVKRIVDRHLTNKQFAYQRFYYDERGEISHGRKGQYRLMFHRL